MDFTAYPAVVCTCGHDLMIAPADPPNNGTDTFNFIGHCANEVEAEAHQLDWVISITAGPPPAARSSRTAEKRDEPEPEEKAAKR